MKADIDQVGEDDVRENVECGPDLWAQEVTERRHLDIDTFRNVASTLMYDLPVKTVR